ncbi:ABC transporter permease [Sinimarinibacterium sp. NLF-5-8]|nr:ABC transporter permease [Sinimarinibacterium sp. NLF-5-8]QHS11128.1 ABC transporter permease [Sinimarinibacterium sp. NLF-5-8]
MSAVESVDQDINPNADPLANRTGFNTLLKKEIRRFWAVLGQTVAAPVVTAVLYLLVFAQALEGRASAYEGVSYTEFLVPGLIMMAVIQNAFANTSSSLLQSKIMGNLVFLQMSPLSPLEWFGAYILAALFRVILVTLAMFAVIWFFVPLTIHAPLALLATFFLTASSLAAMGIVAGIVAEKFDHMATFTNFFIMPLSFLSGVFYSVHSLPPLWQSASYLNPFFYMIDGFRYGFFGHADVSIGYSLLWCAGFFVLASSLALWMLMTGYKLKR